MLETSCQVKDEQQESVIGFLQLFLLYIVLLQCFFHWGYNLSNFIATAQCVPAQQQTYYTYYYTYYNSSPSNP